jgi:hypothetical protein
MLRLKAGGTTAETASGATIGVSATGMSRIMTAQWRVVTAEERQDFLFEKKQQKAFDDFGCGLS